MHIHCICLINDLVKCGLTGIWLACLFQIFNHNLQSMISKQNTVSYQFKGYIGQLNHQDFVLIIPLDFWYVFKKVKLDNLLKIHLRLQFTAFITAGRCVPHNENQIPIFSVINLSSYCCFMQGKWPLKKLNCNSLKITQLEFPSSLPKQHSLESVFLSVTW